MLASWLALGGYTAALERLGHLVLDCPFPGNQVMGVELLRQFMPTVEDLESCDAILSMFHEYTQPWLEAIYGLENWQRVMRATQVVARFDESMDRADLLLPKRVPELLKWTHAASFPAQQDAKKFNGVWQPFGADVTMFNKEDEIDKRYDVAFIGSMYPMRAKYYQALAREMPPFIQLRVGDAVVRDLSGPLPLACTRLLAENYRQIKIFFCLPPMSRLLVNKVFEVMACGTFVMYPQLPGDAAENMKLFEDGKHIVYYKGGYFKKNVAQIQYYLEHEEERETIAAAACAKVHGEHTLWQMLIELIGLARPVEVSA